MIKYYHLIFLFKIHHYRTVFFIQCLFTQNGAHSLDLQFMDQMLQCSQEMGVTPGNTKNFRFHFFVIFMWFIESTFL